MRLKVILGVTFVVGVNAYAPSATAQMQQQYVTSQRGGLTIPQSLLLRADEVIQ
jgi:hypothetical protein